MGRVGRYLVDFCAPAGERGDFDAVVVGFVVVVIIIMLIMLSMSRIGIIEFIKGRIMTGW